MISLEFEYGGQRLPLPEIRELVNANFSQHVSRLVPGSASAFDKLELGMVSVV